MVAVGHAIVDRIGFVDDAVLAAAGLAKGSMRLVDSPAELVVPGAGTPRWDWAAGSAGNTAAGLALLGSSVAFVGRVGDDALGAAYAADMAGLGVELHPGRTWGYGDHLVAPIAPSSPSTPPGGPVPTPPGGPVPTPPGGPATDAGPAPGPEDASGQCLVLVTPDGERTMTTYLGASTTLGPSDLPAELVARASVLYAEGYLWDSPGAVAAVDGALRSSGAGAGQGPTFALSLSDPFCVERHRDAFLALVSEQVGLLFANEAEIVALTGLGRLDDAIGSVGGWGCVVAITRGAAGSVVVRGEEVVSVPAVPVPEVVDTTGAGDLYAAGFLRAFVAGCTLEQCARLGSVAAGEVVGHVGARPMASLRSLAEAAGLLPPVGARVAE